jgi:hypothetical protein
MKTMLIWLLLPIGGALSCGEAGAYAVRRSVLGNGATPAAGVSGAAHILHGTAGQAVVGTSGGATYTMCHGYWCNGGAHVVAVDDPPVPRDLPSELALGPPVPNPARREVRFALALPRASQVVLTIYDAQGRVVRDARGPIDAGRHTLLWDGAGRDGRNCGSGMYFARIVIDGRPFATRRIVIVR